MLIHVSSKKSDWSSNRFFSAEIDELVEIHIDANDEEIRCLPPASGEHENIMRRFAAENVFFSNPGVAIFPRKCNQITIKFSFCWLIYPLRRFQWLFLSTRMTGTGV